MALHTAKFSKILRNWNLISDVKNVKFIPDSLAPVKKKDVGNGRGALRWSSKATLFIRT
ncbi:hypothetical protein [uncultured Cohaesibacter sp.]|uniref:hypothetical protein n=1 Tax=uncultured Cohaesibacter sp. TaxID=1002546 RepID=UPI002AA7942E|nr:hypothetical protein [uncultured Cohaesibacter sp.]